MALKLYLVIATNAIDRLVYVKEGRKTAHCLHTHTHTHKLIEHLYKWRTWLKIASKNSFYLFTNKLTDSLMSLW